MLASNLRGNYSFLPAIAAFSAGAIAMEGHEVVHVIFAAPLPYRKAFEAVDRFLRDCRRPPQALCGIELRSPRPMTLADFESFNRGYVELLKEREILIGGVNPVARTNVAPLVDPPAEPTLYAFSYTTPCPDSPASFVVSGGGDRIIQSDRKDAPEIVCPGGPGDISVDGLRDKMSFVIGLMEKRLAGLGAGWTQVTAVQVYTAHDIFPLLQPLLLPRLGPANAHGIRWHLVRPPVQGMEFEMDVRSCRQEWVLSSSGRD